MKSTVRREGSRDNNVTKPRSGAPKKLTEDDLARIKQRILEDPHATIKDLLAVVDFKCHRRSIQRLLQTDEMRKGQQHQQPDIKSKDTTKPLA
jgi:transposase